MRNQSCFLHSSVSRVRLVTSVFYADLRHPQAHLQPVFLMNGPVLFASSESGFIPIPTFPEQESVLVHLFEPYVGQ